MFVRWKKRKVSNGGDVLLMAVLVQTSHEDDKPGKKTEKYLGSIRESLLNSEASAISTAFREAFWESVSLKLDGIAPDRWSRAKIEASLEKVARKPSNEEMEILQAFRELSRSAPIKRVLIDDLRWDTSEMEATRDGNH